MSKERNHPADVRLAIRLHLALEAVRAAIEAHEAGESDCPDYHPDTLRGYEFQLGCFDSYLESNLRYTGRLRRLYERDRTPALTAG